MEDNENKTIDALLEQALDSMLEETEEAEADGLQQDAGEKNADPELSAEKKTEEEQQALHLAEMEPDRLPFPDSLEPEEIPEPDSDAQTSFDVIEAEEADSMEEPSVSDEQLLDDLALEEDKPKKERKTVLIAAACAVLAFGSGCTLMALTGPRPSKSGMEFSAGAMVLRQETFQVEYGDPVSLKPSYYLQSGLGKDSKVECPRLMRDYGSETDKAGNLVSEEPVAAGDYDFFITTGSHMIYFVVSVSDTTPPVWEKTESALSFDEGELRTLDLEEYFRATDPSGTSLKVDGDYSLSKAGKYSLQIQAVDAFGNSTDAKTLSLNINHIDTDEEKAAAKKLKDYDSLKENSEDLKKSADSLRDENDTLRDTIDELEQENEDLKEKSESFDKKEKELQEALERAETDQKTLQEQFNLLKEQLDALLSAQPSDSQRAEPQTSQSEEN